MDRLVNSCKFLHVRKISFVLYYSLIWYEKLRSNIRDYQKRKLVSFKSIVLKALSTNLIKKKNKNMLLFFFCQHFKFNMRRNLLTNKVQKHTIPDETTISASFIICFPSHPPTLLQSSTRPSISTS